MMFSIIGNACKSVFNRVKDIIKQWTKPATLIVVDKRTIKKYMKQVRKKSGGQTWGTFLKNHAHEIWACDFTVIHTLFFKPLYAFVVVEHESRKIVHTAVTTNPTDEWTTQQIREAIPWGKRPKYLIHDHDGKFGRQFKALLKGSGIQTLNAPPKAPKVNALCEQFIGSLKRECRVHANGCWASGSGCLDPPPFSSHEA